MIIHPWELIRSSLKYPCLALDSVTRVHHRLLDKVIAGITTHPWIFGAGFFADGWGDVSIVRDFQSYLNDESSLYNTIPLESNSIQWETQSTFLSSHDAMMWRGAFPTPLTALSLEHILPVQSHTCYIEVVRPKCWGQLKEPIPDGQSQHPIVVLLPGTGDQGFVHRRNSIALPLAGQGVGSIVRTTARLNE